MLGWTANKGLPITGQTAHPRMQLPNQGPGKPDRPSQNAKAQTSYPRGQCKSVLDKRGCKSQNPLTSKVPLRRIHQDKLTCREHLQTTLEETRQEA